MRAMLLSAGRGERMRPLTLKTPKPLLSVKGEPLIVHHLKALSKAGIDEVVINLGYLGDKIRQALGNGQSYGVSIEYSYEDPILNTGGGVAKALPLLGSDPFIVLSSDLYTDYPYERLCVAPKGLIHLVMVDNPPFHPQGDYSLVDGKLYREGKQRLNFGGIGLYRPELFSGCPSGAFPLSQLFEKAIEQGQATGEYYSGYWSNLGTPEQLHELLAS